jgi:hypothetical protein
MAVLPTESLLTAGGPVKGSLGLFGGAKSVSVGVSGETRDDGTWAGLHQRVKSRHTRDLTPESPLVLMILLDQALEPRWGVYR